MRGCLQPYLHGEGTCTLAGLSIHRRRWTLGWGTVLLDTFERHQDGRSVVSHDFRASSSSCQKYPRNPVPRRLMRIVSRKPAAHNRQVLGLRKVEPPSMNSGVSARRFHGNVLCRIVVEGVGCLYDTPCLFHSDHSRPTIRRGQVIDLAGRPRVRIQRVEVPGPSLPRGGTVTRRHSGGDFLGTCPQVGFACHGQFSSAQGNTGIISNRSVLGNSLSLRARHASARKHPAAPAPPAASYPEGSAAIGERQAKRHHSRCNPFLLFAFLRSPDNPHIATCECDHFCFTSRWQKAGGLTPSRSAMSISLQPAAFSSISLRPRWLH